MEWTGGGKRALSLTPKVNRFGCGQTPNLRSSKTPERHEPIVSRSTQNYQLLHQKRSLLAPPKAGFKPIYEIALLRRKAEERVSAAVTPQKPQELSPIRMRKYEESKSKEPSTRTLSFRKSVAGSQLPDTKLLRWYADVTGREEKMLKASIQALNKRLSVLRSHLPNL